MILATILLGPGSESVVAEAIRSVEKDVDGFVLIESGGAGPALRAAYEAVTKPAHTTHYEWANDYGAARQFALDEARRFGATHAVTVDPDERLELGDTFRAQLEAYPDVEVWILPDRDTGYFKERVIRTSAPVHWHGLSCEFVDGRDTAGAKMPGVFWELPKTPEQERRRYERGVVNMRKMIDAGDDCYRWRRHLGTCLMGLGRQAEALEAYEAGLPLATNADETAWMRYLICEQYVLEGRMADARKLAAEGLGDHAGFIPEFGWILSYTDFKADRLQNASRWAQLILHTPQDRTRIGFRGEKCVTGAKQVLMAIHSPQAPDVVEVEGIKVPVKTVSPNMQRIIAAGGYEKDELDALRGLLSPSDRVLELGSGIGLLAAFCAKRLEDSSRVLTVEADPKMEAAIRATFAANDVAPELLVAAVSGQGTPMAVDRAEDFWSTKTWHQPKTGEEHDTVEGASLSALVERHRPTVVICDIEGTEVTLKGTELPGVRAVLIEVHSAEADQIVEDWLVLQNFTRRDVARRVRLYERNAT
jgi:FkbM family methyltransferase